MRLKINTSTLIQVLLGICDILNLLLPQLSAKNQTVVATVLAILHVVVNRIAHLSNPDGTDAKNAVAPSAQSPTAVK